MRTRSTPVAAVLSRPKDAERMSQLADDHGLDAGGGGALVQSGSRRRLSVRMSLSQLEA
jgi:hypothetical protein